MRHVLGIVSGCLLGLAIVGLIIAFDEPSGPPAACIEALEDAEALIEHQAAAMGFTIDLLDGLSGDDLSALEDAANQLDGLIPVVEEATADYEASAKECRG